MLEELSEHLRDCVGGSRKAKNWEEHNIWEARATLIEEEFMVLPQTLLSEDEKARKKEE